MFRSSILCMLTALGLLLCCQFQAHSEDYPYTAYVTADQTEVRCGPSAQHYMTHRMFAGEEVQVYRREATGWLAIRPPDGSHSWIPADVVEETDHKGVYRVLAANAAYIGTPDKSVKTHHYHVKLGPGELVEVIGQKTVNTVNGIETWLKIAPPAGEFRWIHISQISKSSPREQAIGYFVLTYCLLQISAAPIGVFILLARRRRTPGPTR
jgi:SH3-like domain-containing protein